jgi:predicted choloylglycine hydrolase
MTLSLTFDAVAEPQPGTKWRARWDLSWPEYEAWFRRRGGDAGPDLSACEAALARHMPELVPVHARLAGLAGGGDRAARFLSGWCPPEYLGGCSIAAHARGGTARLIRNYDLAPDLNEGLLLNSAWTRRPVMGMVEFLWGLSDGVNANGLAAAIAYGGRRELGEGFGITHILRYVLETCRDVEGALKVLARVPSHMAYNVVLADRSGATASVELAPGTAMRRVVPALATNHQHGGTRADRPGFTRTGAPAPVCGIDEVGRGPWAGPVVAAAVILDPAALPDGLNDSKIVPRRRRETLAAALHASAAVGIGAASVEEIARLNILGASLLAMARAVAALPHRPAFALSTATGCQAGCPARPRRCARATPPASRSPPRRSSPRLPATR